MKQRCTWAFFVNAAGGKEKPIVIGKTQNPRRLKHFKDKSQPHKCCYYANKKAWMKTEIMVKVLDTLNMRVRKQGCSIVLFLDNASCHPSDLKDKFSNIDIVFLPKIQHLKRSLLMLEL